MEPTTDRFRQQAIAALDDAGLQKALAKTAVGFPMKRLAAVNRLPEFETLRDQAVAIKDHTLDNLDWYLERFEHKVVENGGKVHWCRTGDDARAAVLDICRKAGAKTVTKGKSMVGEELAINEHLEANGIAPIETDLGEYIIQLRHEPPSHMVAPAIHVSRDQVEAAFREHHTDLDASRNLDAQEDLLKEARAILREQFIAADVGITGANFMIA
ncbi:MAG: LUD domain-containing protein, partial [Rhodospirillales bacterium]|nr:LUD domain-containing protein [Rhodospirillales bacterium]